MSDLGKLRDDLVDAVAHRIIGSEGHEWPSAMMHNKASALLAALDAKPEPPKIRVPKVCDPGIPAFKPLPEPPNVAPTYKDSGGTIYCSTCNTALDWDAADTPEPPKPAERLTCDCDTSRALRAERDELLRRIERARAQYRGATLHGRDWIVGVAVDRILLGRDA